MRSLVLLLLALSTAGCASLTQQCATALLETMAQVCVDVICDEGEDGEFVDPNDEPTRPTVREEAAAPDWRPSEGECDIVRGDDGVTVSCADGTRAKFARGEESAPPLVDERADDDACRVVRQGIDGDGDGALSSTELTGRTLDCARGPTLQGHLAIQGPEDVARLAGRRALTGGLHVRSATLVRLEAPQLQSIGGALRVEHVPALEVVTLSSLARVSGDVVVTRAAQLQTLALPALAHVGGGVIAVENPQLLQSTVEELVFRLSRHGFAGPVELAGNRP